jgi:hypothetical protein
VVALDTRLAPGPELFPAGWEETPIAAQQSDLDAWQADPEPLWHHVGYRAVRDEAVAAGLAWAPRRRMDHRPAAAARVLEATWLEGLLRRAFSERRRWPLRRAGHEQLVPASPTWTAVSCA